MHGNFTSRSSGGKRWAVVVPNTKVSKGNSIKAQLESSSTVVGSEAQKKNVKQRIRIFRQWLHDNGAVISKDIELRVTDATSSIPIAEYANASMEYGEDISSKNDESSTDDAKDLGVYALRDIPEDTVVCNISKSAILSSRNCGIADLLDECGLEGSFALSIAVMYELALGERSVWYGYLQMLPEHIDLPIFWTREQVDLLGLFDSEFGIKVLMDKKHIADEYRTIVRDFLECNEQVFKYQGLDINGDKFSLDAFKHATAIVSSRAHEVDDYNGVSLVPFVEMFNHSSKEHVHFETEAAVCTICGEAYCDCNEDDSDSEDDNDEEMSSFITDSDVEMSEPSSEEENVNTTKKELSRKNHKKVKNVSDEEDSPAPPSKRMRLREIADTEADFIEQPVSDGDYSSDDTDDEDAMVVFDEENEEQFDGKEDKFRNIVERLLGHGLPPTPISTPKQSESQKSSSSSNISQMKDDSDNKSEVDEAVIEEEEEDDEEEPELFDISKYFTDEEDSDDDDDEDAKLIKDKKRSKETKNMQVVEYFPTIEEDPLADCADIDLLQMRTIRLCEAKEEIFGTYGELDNIELLNKYGFVETGINEFNKVKVSFSDIVQMLMFSDISRFPVHGGPPGKGKKTTHDKSVRKTMSLWSKEHQESMKQIADMIHSIHRFDMETVTHRLMWWEMIGSLVAEVVIDELTGENDEDHEEEEEGIEVQSSIGSDNDEEDSSFIVGSDDEEEEEEEEKEEEEDEEEDEQVTSKSNGTKRAQVEDLMDDLENALGGLDNNDDGEEDDVNSNGDKDMNVIQQELTAEAEHESDNLDAEDYVEEEEDEGNQDEEEEEDGNRKNKYGEQGFYFGSDGSVSLPLLMAMNVLLLSEPLFSRFVRGCIWAVSSSGLAVPEEEVTRGLTPASRRAARRAYEMQTAAWIASAVRSSNENRRAVKLALTSTSARAIRTFLLQIAFGACSAGDDSNDVGRVATTWVAVNGRTGPRLFGEFLAQYDVDANDVNDDIDGSMGAARTLARHALVSPRVLRVRALCDALARFNSQQLQHGVLSEIQAIGVGMGASVRDCSRAARAEALAAAAKAQLERAVA